MKNVIKLSAKSAFSGIHKKIICSGKTILEGIN